MEWRRESGRGIVTETSVANSTTGSTASKGNASGGVDSSIGNNDILPKKSSNAVTDKLTKELDSKYELQAQMLEKQKKLAQDQLEKVCVVMHSFIGVNIIEMIIYIYIYLGRKRIRGIA